MSDESNPLKPSGPRPIKLRPEPMPPTIASPHQLAQFTAATAPGYSPRPQMSASAYNTPTSREPNTQTTATPAAQPTETPAAQSTATPAAQPTATPAAQPTTAPAPQAASATSAQPATVAISAASSTVQATREQIKEYNDKLNRSPIKPLPPQAITDLDKFTGFKFVTLLGLILEMRDIYETITGTFEWEMCETQTDRCEEYIRKKCTRRRVFLVVSGGLGKEIVPKVHNLPNVYAIYVFCSDLSFHIPWAAAYPKVRVVCNDDTVHLIPRLAIDVAQSNIDWGNALLGKGDHKGAKEKFTKAKENLDSENCKRADKAMQTEVTQKLEQCK
ncbi:unnamed protein product [Adineta ricciae]|nr:unnamed protein product [Adineta ricciae]